MERRVFMLTAAAAPLLSAASSNSALDGRWGLTVPGNERRRAWWIEIKGANTPKPSGSFIGASGGGLDEITDLKVADGEARWSFTKGTADKPWKCAYRAHIEGGRLVGVAEVEGQQPQPFTGTRAPKLKAVDAAKLKRGTPVELFNAKDLSGWHAVRDNAPMLWKVENGSLKNGPGTTDLATNGRFMNFDLHVEYRVASKSNSGVGLRGRYEVQIFGDYGAPPDTHGSGALYSRILPTSNAGKPPEEWQTLDITLAGNVVTVVLNGTKVIDRGVIDGLTAMAIDPNEGEPGPILLQGDHGPVEFRKIVLTPLLG